LSRNATDLPEKSLESLKKKFKPLKGSTVDRMSFSSVKEIVAFATTNLTKK